MQNNLDLRTVAMRVIFSHVEKARRLGFPDNTLVLSAIMLQVLGKAEGGSADAAASLALDFHHKCVGPEEAAALVRILGEEKPLHVKESIINALAHVKSQEVGKALFELAQDGSQPFSLRACAACALAFQDSPDAAMPLCSLLENGGEAKAVWHPFTALIALAEGGKIAPMGRERSALALARGFEKIAPTLPEKRAKETERWVSKSIACWRLGIASQVKESLAKSLMAPKEPSVAAAGSGGKKKPALSR